MKNNLDEDIKIAEEIIKCDGCRFATCEQCEINWTQVNSISNVLKALKSYREDYNHRCQLAIDRAKEIEKLKSELETYKKIAEKLAEQVKRDTVFYDTEGISSCDLSEEKYCKCSKHNNGANCKQCIIDWARKEVEKDG